MNKFETHDDFFENIPLKPHGCVQFETKECTFRFFYGKRKLHYDKYFREDLCKPNKFGFKTNDFQLIHKDNLLGYVMYNDDPSSLYAATLLYYIAGRKIYG